MGNRASSNRVRTAALPQRLFRTGPTAEDFKAYADDLSELQKFLNEKFAVGRLRQSAEFNAAYLDALQVKLEQLRNVRRLIQSRRGRRMADNIPPTLTTLLDAIEPQCQTAVDELIRLQAEQSSSGALELAQVQVDVDLSATARNMDTSVTGTTSPPVSVQSPTVSTVDVPPLLPSNTVLSDDGDDDDEEHQNETRDDDSDEEKNPDDFSSQASSTDQDDYASIDQWGDSVLADSDDQSHITKWKIDRKANDFLETVFAEYEKARERTLRRQLEITFEGEPGVDAGGLTKEFFHLAFEAVLSKTYKDCPMFEGSRGHLIPNATTEHLVAGYKYLGMMIVHAALIGCPGLPGLSPAIQNYIVHAEGPASIENLAYEASIDDVADTGLKNLLEKLNEGESLTEADNELLMTWMERCNCRLLLTDSSRHLISQTVLIHYVFNSRIVQIEAIAKGMEMFELRDFLHKNPSGSNLAFVFPSEDELQVTPEMLTAVTVVGMSGDSDDVFNEQTFDFFQRFLRELSDGQMGDKKLSDLIQYVCGSPYLPAQLILTFSSELVYPVAHACFNQLELPTRHQDYTAFRDAFAFALLHGTAFTDE